MKKRLQTLIGIAACAVMLFGCQKAEDPVAPVASSVPETTVAAPVMISIDGGAEPLMISEENTILELTCAQQAESLIAQAAEVTWLDEIRLSGFVPQAKEILRLEEIFEGVPVSYDEVEILGGIYPADLKEMDLMLLQQDQIETLGKELSVLKELQTIRLSPEGSVGMVSLEDAAALHALYPDLT